ncbi:MAG: short-chain fatty acyl-CoA regulator family protein [Corynebacterium sp.]|nr:short-chain fatty acyl-CoA regulator family protein [Corynebacterium sp.]
MSKLYVGAKIRTLRRTLGLTQTAMAKQANLSTSYLNQLENDQRPLTATVLMTLSKTFAVETSYFSPDTNARFVADLKEAFTSAGLSNIGIEELHDLADRYPELARGIVHLSHTLADISATSASFTNDNEIPLTPSPLYVRKSWNASAFEHVRDFFYERRNHIPELDELAENFAETLGDPGMRVTRLAAALDANHGVKVRYKAHQDGPRRIFSDQQVKLRCDLTEAQQCFELAMQWCFLEHHGVLVRLSADPNLSPESRALTRVGLAQYFAAAVVMPYSRFLDAANRTAYDIDRIRAYFGTGFETTCHRLSTLQREGQQGVPFFFIRTDRAGNISKRQSATSFHFSRSGGACPQWIIHRAFETPGRIVRQLAQMPDGRTYLWIARTVTGRSQGFGTTPTQFAIGLGCDLEQARNLVYSQGLDLTPEAATPIGAGCRICERPACPQRAFPATGLELEINENISPDMPYQPHIEFQQILIKK